MSTASQGKDFHSLVEKVKYLCLSLSPAGWFLILLLEVVKGQCAWTVTARRQSIKIPWHARDSRLSGSELLCKTQRYCVSQSKVKKMAEGWLRELQYWAEYISLFYLDERICFSEFWQVTSMTLKIVPVHRFKITAVITLYIKCVGKAIWKPKLLPSAWLPYVPKNRVWFYIVPGKWKVLGSMFL